MIEKWKILPYSSEIHPGRYRVYVRCSPGGIKEIADFFQGSAGRPWKSADPEFDFTFYLNGIPDEEAVLLDKRIEGLKYKLERESGISPAPSEPVSGFGAPSPARETQPPTPSASGVSSSDKLPTAAAEESAREYTEKVKEKKADARNCFMDIAGMISDAGKTPGGSAAKENVTPGPDKNVSRGDKSRSVPSVEFDVFETDKVNGLKNKKKDNGK